MMNPFSWLQMTNMISYQGLVRTFPNAQDLLDFLKISEGSNYSEEYALEYLAAEIEFDLSSEERRKVMQESKLLDFRYGRLPSQVFDYFYQELNNIQPVR
ncbi:hypothetical protein ACW5W6_07500 [Aeromonas mytilicola]